MKIVFTNGCFDVVHRGHIELFKFAKNKGDFLVVGIDSDSRVKKTKGKSRPINNQEDRKFLLESIEHIDKVVIFNNDHELETLINLHKTDFLVIGSDYKDKRVVGHEYAKELIFFERINGFSSTKIIQNFIDW